MGNTEKNNETLHFKAVKAKEITSEVAVPKKETIASETKTDAPFSKAYEEHGIATEKPEKTNDVKITDNKSVTDKTETQVIPETVAEAAFEKEEEAEEVVFAGDSAPQKAPEDRTPPAEVRADAYDDVENIVFAEQDKTPKKSKIAKHSQKKKFPVGPVVAAVLALCVCAGTGVVVWKMMDKNAAPTSASVNSQSAGDGTSADLSVVSKNPEEIADPSLTSEEPLDLDRVDTTNILFGQNVTVEGVNLAGKTLTQAYDAMEDRLLELREPISITVVCDGKSMTLSQNDFNFDSNLASVLLQAYHYSRGELDHPTVENTFENGVTDFKVNTAINTKSVDEAIDKTAAFYDVQPVDAHVTSFDPTATDKFTYADGSDGFLVDHNELSTKIKAILDQGEKTGTVSISTQQTPFKVSLADIKANTKLIASHCTTANNAYNSVHNMELAIKAASGTIVKPGESFSFNEMTGDTTNDNEHHYPNGTTGSYLSSTAYSHGEVVQDYGGGICQASTTLYLCALKADMEIQDRYAHMYASSYAPYGLDATVDYGNLDMRFKNNKEYPIYIATYVYDNDGDGLDELMVEMYGPLSTEYDEVVPVGWVTYAGEKGFSAKGAKVYFKDGKEVNRVILPAGSYDYHFESYYDVIGYMPSDIENGPSVSPTSYVPTVYSPGGCGDSEPIAYGTAAEVLAKARGQAQSKPDNQSGTGSVISDSSTPVEQSSEESVDYGTVITTTEQSSEAPAQESSAESADSSDQSSEEDNTGSSDEPAPEQSEEQSNEQSDEQSDEQPDGQPDGQPEEPAESTDEPSADTAN